MHLYAPVHLFENNFSFLLLGNGKRSGAEPMEGSENNLDNVSPKMRFLQRLMAASQYRRDPYQERNDVMDNQDVYQNMQALQDDALESKSIERSSFGMDDDVEQERKLAAMTAAQGSKQRPGLDEQTRNYLRKLVRILNVIHVHY